MNSSLSLIKRFSKEILDTHAGLKVSLQMRSLRERFAAHYAAEVLLATALVSFVFLCDF